MTEQRSVYVKYIGKKPLKTDTVCRTDTVWTGNGDIQLVPRDVALKLVRHTKVWTPVSAEEAARFESALLGEGVEAMAVGGKEVAASPSVVKTAGVVGGGLRAAEEPDELPPRDRREVARGIGEAMAVAGKEAEDGVDVDDGPDPVTAAGDFEASGDFEVGEQQKPADEGEGEEQSQSVGDASKVDLVKLIKEMPKDDEHFSEKTGVPLVKKVRELAGDSSITHVHVKQAWDKVNG